MEKGERKDVIRRINREVGKKKSMWGNELPFTHAERTSETFTFLSHTYSLQLGYEGKLVL